MASIDPAMPWVFSFVTFLTVQIVSPSLLPRFLICQVNAAWIKLSLISRRILNGDNRDRSDCAYHVYSGLVLPIQLLTPVLLPEALIWFILSSHMSLSSKYLQRLCSQMNLSAKYLQRLHPWDFEVVFLYCKPSELGKPSHTVCAYERISF